MTFILSFTYFIRILHGVLNYLLREKPVGTNANVDLQDLDILIPVKNEEERLRPSLEKLIPISKLVNSITILNDDSNDDTKAILELYRGHFKIVHGRKKPDYWKGKNWACEQLASYSSSEYILFIDIDVSIDESSLNMLKRHAIKGEYDAVSVFPHLTRKNKFEIIFNDILNSTILFNIVLPWVSKIKASSYSAANGQCLFFKRSSYWNWHKKLKDSWIEDVAIFREMKARNLKVSTLLSSGGIECKMYDDFQSGINGFSKNLFAGFDYSLPSIIIFLIYNIVVPFTVLYLSWTYPWMLIFILLELILLSFRNSKDGFLSLLLFIPRNLIWLFIAMKSIYWHYSNKTKWR